MTQGGDKMDAPINLIELSLNEMERFLDALGQKKYRAKQILGWIYKGITAIDDMTDIPKELREELRKVAYIGSMELKEKYVSKDGTVKYLFVLKDGNIIESVLMTYKHGLAICISSQVGCKMGCRFCASSHLGFIRNLTPGEMMEQVLAVQNDCKTRIGNITIMGIGEPLDNYENLVKFLKLANIPEGLNISLRKINVSTCGLVPGILRLANEGLPVNLSISIHAPVDEKRQKLMPVGKSYSLDKIIEACNIYTEKTRRRMTFEYIMIDGFNDSREDALILAGRIRGMLCHVNLIPANCIEGTGFKPSARMNMEVFKSLLENSGITVTIRRELGKDIDAACGQLRRRRLIEEEEKSK